MAPNMVHAFGAAWNLYADHFSCAGILAEIICVSETILLTTMASIVNFHMVQGPLTQSVEYLPFKQRVAGSSPARPTITSPSSSPVQDTGLSRRRQRFKSAWGRHQWYQGLRWHSESFFIALFLPSPPLSPLWIDVQWPRFDLSL